jgi:hypothetical protein
MYREKAFPIGALLLVVVVAAALMGVGYGLWSKTLDIGGTVETGEVNAEFVLGAVTEEDHGKDVGDCTAALLDPETLEVTVSNGYPSYECWVDFQVRNPGGIPIHIYQPDFTSLPPSTEVTVDTTACYDDDLQVHTGELSPVCTIHVHVEQGGAQNATYTFAATVEARQFNEPRCDPDDLVQQIEAANANPDPDTINLDGNCTYTLTAVDNDTDGPNGLPSITSEITINGNGASIERDVAAPDFRIFHVALDGNLTLNDVTIRNGQAGSSNGGGMYVHGVLMLNRCTIAENTAAAGGGLYFVVWPYVAAQINETTVSNNQSSGSGGGIDNHGAYLTIVNSTLSGNTAGGGGGGIIHSGGSLTLRSTTIANNSASIGGGLSNYGYPNLYNTIIANNSGGDCARYTTSINSHDYNLDSDGSCNLTQPHDLPGIDPLLGSLANNGGPTWTHALLSGSPAIDAGDDTVCPATDQRGVTRPQGPHCDIGAFELEIP